MPAPTTPPPAAPPRHDPAAVRRARTAIATARRTVVDLLDDATAQRARLVDWTGGHRRRHDEEVAAQVAAARDVLDALDALDLQVAFADARARRDVADWLHATSVVAMPSRQPRRAGPSHDHEVGP